MEKIIQLLNSKGYEASLLSDYKLKIADVGLAYVVSNWLMKENTNKSMPWFFEFEDSTFGHCNLILTMCDYDEEQCTEDGSIAHYAPANCINLLHKWINDYLPDHDAFNKTHASDVMKLLQDKGYIARCSSRNITAFDAGIDIPLYNWLDGLEAPNYWKIKIKKIYPDMDKCNINFKCKISVIIGSNQTAYACNTLYRWIDKYLPNRSEFNYKEEKEMKTFEDLAELFEKKGYTWVRTCDITSATIGLIIDDIEDQIANWLDKTDLDIPAGIVFSTDTLHYGENTKRMLTISYSGFTGKNKSKMNMLYDWLDNNFPDKKDLMEDENDTDGLMNNLIDIFKEKDYDEVQWKDSNTFELCGIAYDDLLVDEIFQHAFVNVKATLEKTSIAGDASLVFTFADDKHEGMQELYDFMDSEFECVRKPDSLQDVMNLIADRGYTSRICHRNNRTYFIMNIDSNSANKFATAMIDDWIFTSVSNPTGAAVTATLCALGYNVSADAAYKLYRCVYDLLDPVAKDIDNLSLYPGNMFTFNIAPNWYNGYMARRDSFMNNYNWQTANTMFDPFNLFGPYGYKWNNGMFCSTGHDYMPCAGAMELQNYQDEINSELDSITNDDGTLDMEYIKAAYDNSREALKHLVALRHEYKLRLLNPRDEE